MKRLILLAAVLASQLVLAQPASAYQVGGYFPTLPPGHALPSDAACAAQVRHSSWEPRPENAAANHRTPGSDTWSQYGGSDEFAYVARVTGNFTGTTDQIIQWAACKWGIDENWVRAQVDTESSWIQSTAGDCRGSPIPDAHGCQSWGLLQVKGTDGVGPDANYPGTFPYSRDDTAFAVDYALAIRRACFEGVISWLGGSYGPGDLTGCMGEWYSGDWYDSGAQGYILDFQAALNSKVWNNYGAGPAPTPPPPQAPYSANRGSGLRI